MKFKSTFQQTSTEYKSKFLTDFADNRDEEDPTYLDLCQLNEPIDIELDINDREDFNRSTSNHKFSDNMSFVNNQLATESAKIVEKEVMEKYNSHFARDITNGKLIFTRRDIEQQQMNLINKIVQQMGNNLLAGKINVMNISLPVALFAKYSMLQRDAYITRILINVIQQINHVQDPVLKLAYFLAH
jgi:hypothetical protein